MPVDDYTFPEESLHSFVKTFANSYIQNKAAAVFCQKVLGGISGTSVSSGVGMPYVNDQCG